jgi:hypothetical protein
MTQSVEPTSVVAGIREPRPFLYLDPRPVGVTVPELDAEGLARLEDSVIDDVPMLVRSLVNFTIALQNRRELESGHRQPIALSVLNRRRRSARAWILAILSGKLDQATMHAVTTVWIPQLASSGPDLRRALRPGIAIFEFLRGAMTALLFDAPAENLLPHARALNVLETVLSTQLAAVHQIARRAVVE